MTCDQPVLHLHDFPGELSMNLLCKIGAVSSLDSSHAYRMDDGESLFGRAQITANVAPHGMPVCARTAAWVWNGGEFPEVIDVLSGRHFRSQVFGRRIRVFTRRVPVKHMSNLGDLKLTNPPRTVCDLAFLAADEIVNESLVEPASQLMHKYRIPVSSCLEIIESNKYLHNKQQARVIVEFLARCSNKPSELVEELLEELHFGGMGRAV